MWYIFSLLTVALGLEYLALIIWFWHIYQSVNAFLRQRSYSGKLRRSIRQAMFNQRLNQDAVTLWLSIIGSTTLAIWVVVGLFWLGQTIISKILL